VDSEKIVQVIRVQRKVYPEDLSALVLSNGAFDSVLRNLLV